MTIDFNNYQAILTNTPSEIFTKVFIEKQNHEGIVDLGYDYELIKHIEINKQTIDNWSKKYKYYYDVQNDIFYDIEDLYEFCE